MTPAEIATIKATVPALSAHGEAITKEFYRVLLSENPSLRPMFDPERQVDGRQPRALAAAILAYASNIDRLETLEAPVDRIACRHIRFGVQPEHYPIVGDVLLRAIQTVLGEAATPGVLNAWGSAYHRLAAIMIELERSLAEPDLSPA